MDHNTKKPLEEFNRRWGKEETFDKEQGFKTERVKWRHQLGVHPIFVVASFLDPRTKSLKAFEDRDNPKGVCIM